MQGSFGASVDLARRKHSSLYQATPDLPNRISRHFLIPAVFLNALSLGLK